jgi:hypothetical protein
MIEKNIQTDEFEKKVNQKHKSSVFSLLFSDPDILKELYSAIEGVDLPPETPVSINTLTNVLIKGKLNDVSFILDNRLVILIEHQSTINENMPLRILNYIQRIYEKSIDPDKLFNEKIIKIPKPEFIVLYNGKAPYPEKHELRLSDAFMDITGLSDNNRLSLELIVQVLNINYGQNPKIQQKCETLNNYSMLINKIREYENTGLSLEKSVECAVKYCLQNNILKDFLIKHGSEVMNMLFLEYNLDDHLEARYREGREEGHKEGHKKGELKIINLLKSGKSPDEIIKDYEAD